MYINTLIQMLLATSSEQNSIQLFDRTNDSSESQKTEIGILVHDDEVYSIYSDVPLELKRNQNTVHFRRLLAARNHDEIVKIAANRNMLHSEHISRHIVENEIPTCKREIIEDILYLISSVTTGNSHITVILPATNREFYKNILNKTIEVATDKKEDMEVHSKIKKNTNIDDLMKAVTKMIRAAKGSTGIVKLLDRLIMENDLTHKIVSLDLSYGCITSSNIKSIRRLLKHLKNLESLDISNNEIEDGHIRKIAKILERRNLVYLDVSGNFIEAKGAKAIARALRKHKNLGYLNISGNDIRDNGSIAILNALHENIESLDTSSSNVRDKEVEITENSLDVKLNISFNNISEALLEKLKRRKNIICDAEE